MKFKKYKKIGITEMIEYDPDLTYPKEIMDNLAISLADKRNGSPKKGDMIARNPDNPGDYWLVAREYFEKNYAKEIEVKKHCDNCEFDKYEFAPHCVDCGDEHKYFMEKIGRLPEFDSEEQKAYEWAINQNHQSAMARYAKTLAKYIRRLKNEN